MQQSCLLLRRCCFDIVASVDRQGQLEEVRSRLWRKFGLKSGGPSYRWTYKVGVRPPTPKSGGPDSLPLLPEITPMGLDPKL